MMARFRRDLTHRLHLAEEVLFANPKIVLGLIFLATLFFASAVPRLRIYSDFADLLPQSHPYIQAYNSTKENFGGANNIILAIEVENGTIFTPETLKLIDAATTGVDNLPGVNHNLVSSLTHRTSRKVYLSAEGGFMSEPFYDPESPIGTPEEFEKLRKDVLANPTVYGTLVSPDLKAALIRAQMNEGDIDYAATFGQLLELRKSLDLPGYKVYMTGNPVLMGWVFTYTKQIVMILALTAALLAALLVIYFRRLYGIALPLLGISLSTIWGLGFMSMMGLNLEPLSLPIPFLIAARATSHGVQLVARYYEELAIVKDGKRAARNALDALFRPGSLAIIVDAIGIFVLVLGTAPFNTKLGLSASFWGFSVIFTVHFMVPLALTVLPSPKQNENKNQRVRDALAAFMARTGARKRPAAAMLTGALLLSIAGSWFAVHAKLGDSEPGSPLLARDHDYNLSTTAINALFPGSDDLHMVVRTEGIGSIKDPTAVKAIERLQALMMADPGVGGTKALPAVVRLVNRLTHSDDPRWMQIPDNANEVGGLLFIYMAASPIPGALKEFIGPDENEADVVFYYKDHQADTVARVVALAEESIKTVEAEVPGVHIAISGGTVGIAAASSQALHIDHIKIIPAVMLAAFLLVMTYYQSIHAGWLMVLPMLFSTVMTYAYMGAFHIGINVNTVPVIAVGVGVGIDYAVYFMDRIREETARTRDVGRAVIAAISSTGSAVSFTAVTLVAGVVMWVFLSDLRFQSDAAVLLSFMLVVNAVAAMLIVPAWCVVFKPHFVVATHFDADGILEEDDERRVCAELSSQGERKDAYIQKIGA